MSSQSAHAQGDRNIIIQASGTGNSINLSGGSHLTLISPLRDTIPAPVKDLDLLNPGLRAIPLTGRASDLQSLRNWLNTSQAISIRALIGAGGTGKTRLALELMREAASQPNNPWDAGWLSRQELSRFLAAQNAATWGWQRHTLVVVDYAASFASELPLLLEELSHTEIAPSTPRLRILLLERHASIETGWYSALVPGSYGGAAIKVLFDPWEPAQIQPIHQAAERYAIFANTLDRAAPLQPPATRHPTAVPGLDDALATSLTDPKWADPLMLMMAALTAFETGVPQALSLSRPEVALHLARREAARIRRFAPAQNRHAENLLVHLAAVITLCGGLPRQAALQMAAAESADLGIQYPNGSGAAIAELHSALPTLDQGIDPIRPDLIGEAFLLAAWQTSPGAPMFARALQFSFSNTVQVLIRTAQDFAQPAEQRPIKWLDHIWVLAPDRESRASIYDALPEQTTNLREFALKTTKALLAESEPHDRPRMLTHLSNRQSNLDQREQALASIEEAASLYSELAAAQPAVFGPDFALSLNNLSVQQSDLGQRELALVSIQRAVSLYRQLAAAFPDAFRPNLAVSLNNLSNRRSDLGQRDQALLSSEEAVSIHRELADTRPHAFRPDLALSLSNLSVHQSGLGQHERALKSSEEVVLIRRELAAASPDAFRPDLALSLNNLSVYQSVLGQHERALASSEQAISIRRELAATRRDAFRHNLASSLNNLSNQQSNLGRREQALASIEEAVSLYRDLSTAHPDAFRPNLARSLGTLASHRASLADIAGALQSTKEGCAILRDHFIRFPEAFEQLATSLIAEYLTYSEKLGLEPDEQLLQPYLSYFAQRNQQEPNQ